jgi:hypothetical protein
MKINFGKYRGLDVKDIPLDYYRWLLLNVPQTTEYEWQDKAIDVIIAYEKIHNITPTRTKIVYDKKSTYDVLSGLLRYAILGKNKKDIVEIQERIDKECERIAESMEANLDNLEWLNKVLEKTGNQMRDTLEEARETLKTKVFINIYDLEAGHYERAFRNHREFVNDMLIKRRFYDLRKAKDSPLLKLFLKKIN